MAGIQVDLTAAGGQQGPGQSAMLGTLWFLPQPLASHPFLKGKGGSVEFVKVIAAAWWGAGWSILLQALMSVLPPAPCPPQPHVALLSA